MHSYSLYNQYLLSEFAIPELVEGTGRPSIFVRKQQLPTSVLGLPPDTRQLHESSADDFSVYRGSDAIYWFFEELGTLRISDGRIIAIDPREDCSPQAMRQLVLGPGLRTLLVQQGHLVFHASAVSIAGKAVMFVGESGAGKSTTAAALAEAGHPVLSDDVALVSRRDEGYAVPCGPQALKIRSADAERLGYTPDGKSESLEDPDRRYFRSKKEPDRDWHPLACVYLLEWGQGPSINTASVERTLPALLSGSYPFYDESEIDSFADHFRRCVQFADDISIRRLSRPRSIDTLDTLVSAIEADQWS